MIYKIFGFSILVDEHKKREIMSIIPVQVSLIITLSLLGSIETVRVLNEPYYNEVTYNRPNSKIINLGATTWLCYIENRTTVRRVILGLNCTITLQMNALSSSHKHVNFSSTSFLDVVHYNSHEGYQKIIIIWAGTKF